MAKDASETTGSTRFRRTLDIIGVAALATAAVTAVAFGGWLPLAAAAVSLATMGTSFAMGAIEFSCDAEMALCEACERPADLPSAAESVTGPQPAQAEGKQWAAAVAVQKSCRNR